MAAVVACVFVRECAVQNAGLERHIAGSEPIACYGRLSKFLGKVLSAEGRQQVEPVHCDPLLCEPLFFLGNWGCEYGKGRTKSFWWEDRVRESFEDVRGWFPSATVRTSLRGLVFSHVQLKTRKYLRGAAKACSELGQQTLLLRLASLPPSLFRF